MRTSYVCTAERRESVIQVHSNPLSGCHPPRTTARSYTRRSSKWPRRTALNAALIFLYINGWEVLDPDMALHDAMTAFATRTLDKGGFATLLEKLDRRVMADD